MSQSKLISISQKKEGTGSKTPLENAFVAVKQNNPETKGYPSTSPYSESFFAGSLPYDYGTNSNGSYNTVYNGGDVTAENVSGTGNVTVTLDNVEIGDLIKQKVTHNSNQMETDSASYDDDVFPLAAVLVKTANPGIVAGPWSTTTGTIYGDITSLKHILADGTVINDSDDADNSDIYLISDSNWSGGDDYGYGPATTVWVNDHTNGYINGAWGTGAGGNYDPEDMHGVGYIRVNAGDEISVAAYTYMESGFDSKGGIDTLSEFVKFSSDAILPAEGQSDIGANSFYYASDTDDNSNSCWIRSDKMIPRTDTYFVAKLDHSNWTNYQEMADAHIKRIPTLTEVHLTGQSGKDILAYKVDAESAVNEYNSLTKMNRLNFSDRGNQFYFFNNSDDILDMGWNCVGVYMVVNGWRDLLKQNGWNTSEFASYSRFETPRLNINPEYNMNGSNVKPLGTTKVNVTSTSIDDVDALYNNPDSRVIPLLVDTAVVTKPRLNERSSTVTYSRSDWRKYYTVPNNEVGGYLVPSGRWNLTPYDQSDDESKYEYRDLGSSSSRDTTFAYQPLQMLTNGTTVVPISTSHYGWGGILENSPQMGNAFSLYLNRESPYLNFRVADTYTDPVTGETYQKKAYAIDNAEGRIANFAIDAGTQVNGGHPQVLDTFKITVDLPANVFPALADELASTQFKVTYGTEKANSITSTSAWTTAKSQSSWMGTTTPSSTVSYDSSANKVTFTVTDWPVGFAIPTINFAVKLGDENDLTKEVKNNSELVFNATLDEYRDNSSTSINTVKKSDGLTAVKEQAATILTTTTTPSRSSSAYDINWQIDAKDFGLEQNSTGDNIVEIFNFLPYQNSEYNEQLSYPQNWLVNNVEISGTLTDTKNYKRDPYTGEMIDPDAGTTVTLYYLTYTDKDREGYPNGTVRYYFLDENGSLTETTDPIEAHNKTMQYIASKITYDPTRKGTDGLSDPWGFTSGVKIPYEYIDDQQGFVKKTGNLQWESINLFIDRDSSTKIGIINNKIRSVGTYEIEPSTVSINNIMTNENKADYYHSGGTWLQKFKHVIAFGIRIKDAGPNSTVSLKYTQDLQTASDKGVSYGNGTNSMNAAASKEQSLKNSVVNRAYIGGSDQTKNYTYSDAISKVGKANIYTKVVNGQITNDGTNPSVLAPTDGTYMGGWYHAYKDLEIGTNTSVVNYSPRPSYRIKSIKVADSEEEIPNAVSLPITSEITNSYTFTDITNDKYIEVVYVNDPKYNVYTKVTNGKITRDNAGTLGPDSFVGDWAVAYTDVPSSVNKTVSYQTRSSDYELDYVKVGTTENNIAPVDKDTYESQYVFDNITSDKYIEVKYVPKSIPEKEVRNDANIDIDGKAVKPGDVLTYGVSVTNNHSYAVDYTITDTIPSVTQYVTNSASDSGSYDSGNRTLTWNVNVAAGQTKKVTFKVTVLDTAKGQRFTNKAVCGTNSNTVSNYVPTIVKDVKNASNVSVDGQQVEPNQPLTYSLTVTNPDIFSKEYTITDVVDSKQTIDSVLDGGTKNGQTITWSNVTVPGGGGTAIVRFTAHVNNYDVTVPNKGVLTGENNLSIDSNTTIVRTGVVHNVSTAVVNGQITKENASDPTDYSSGTTQEMKVAYSSVPHGESRTVRYKPTDGYELDYIEIDGTRVPDASLTPAQKAGTWDFANITADKTIKVVYKPMCKIYTWVEHGQISQSGMDNLGPASYLSTSWATPFTNIPSGTNSNTVKYQPESGYKLKSIFIGDTEDSLQEVTNISTIQSAYTFTNISSDKYIKVIYEPNSGRKIFTLTKNWSGDTEAVRPSSVIVKVRGYAAGEEVPCSETTYALLASEDWTKEISLPAYRTSDKKEIFYKVYESPVPERYTSDHPESAITPTSKYISAQVVLEPDDKSTETSGDWTMKDDDDYNSSLNPSLNMKFRGGFKHFIDVTDNNREITTQDSFGNRIFTNAPTNHTYEIWYTNVGKTTSGKSIDVVVTISDIVLQNRLANNAQVEELGEIIVAPYFAGGWTLNSKNVPSLEANSIRYKAEIKLIDHETTAPIITETELANSGRVPIVFRSLNFGEWFAPITNFSGKQYHTVSSNSIALNPDFINDPNGEFAYGCTTGADYKNVNWESGGNNYAGGEDVYRELKLRAQLYQINSAFAPVMGKNNEWDDINTAATFSKSGAMFYAKTTSANPFFAVYVGSQAGSIWTAPMINYQASDYNNSIKNTFNGYNVQTWVEHGKITKSSTPTDIGDVRVDTAWTTAYTNLTSGSSAIVNYEAEDGYKLNRIEISEHGNPTNIITAFDDSNKYSYTLTGIDADSTIKVVYEPNTPPPSSEYKHIIIQKNWTDDEPSDRPESLNVNIIGYVGTTQCSTNTAVLTANNNWKTELLLPYHDASLNEIIYKAYETEVPGYSSNATSANPVTLSFAKRKKLTNYDTSTYNYENGYEGVKIDFTETSNNNLPLGDYYIVDAQKFALADAEITVSGKIVKNFGSTERIGSNADSYTSKYNFIEYSGNISTSTSWTELDGTYELKWSDVVRDFNGNLYDLKLKVSKISVKTSDSYGTNVPSNIKLVIDNAEGSGSDFINNKGYLDFGSYWKKNGSITTTQSNAVRQYYTVEIYTKSGNKVSDGTLPIFLTDMDHGDDIREGVKILSGVKSPIFTHTSSILTPVYKSSTERTLAGYEYDGHSPEQSILKREKAGIYYLMNVDSNEAIKYAPAGYDARMFDTYKVGEESAYTTTITNSKTPIYTLTINYYLIDSTIKIPDITPNPYVKNDLTEGSTYSVPSPLSTEYELVPDSQQPDVISGKIATAQTVAGTMPANDVVINVYYTFKMKVAKIEKDWSDNEYVDNRPESVSVILKGDDGSSRNVTLTSDGPNSWSREVEVPAATSSGTPIQYSAYEDNVDPTYTSSNPQSNPISINLQTQNTITNTIKHDFPIVKTVTDSAGTDINTKIVGDGDNLYYHIKVDNPYKTERAFKIIDTVPENSIFVSADNEGTNINGVVTWNKIMIPANSTKTVSFVVKTSGNNKTIRNTATATIYNIENTAVSVDPADTKNSNEVVNYTPGFIKTVENAQGVNIDGKSVEPGQTIYYKIEINNTADVSKTYQINDALDTANLQFLNADHDGHLIGSSVVWSDLTVPANGKLTVKIEAKVKETDSTEIKNKAEVVVDLTTIPTNEVKNWKGVIKINKAITNYYNEFGKPFFLFEISGANQKWYRAIELSDSTRTGTADLLYLPSGLPETGTEFTIKEIRNARYELSNAQGITNVTIQTEGSGTSINKYGKTIISKTNPLGEITFTNNIEKWNKDSHADGVKNHIGN